VIQPLLDLALSGKYRWPLRSNFGSSLGPSFWKVLESSTKNALLTLCLCLSVLEIFVEPHDVVFAQLALGVVLLLMWSHISVLVRIPALGKCSFVESPLINNLGFSSVRILRSNI
jgi:hypothetical protein